MKKITPYLFFLITLGICSQEKELISIQKNYNDWGWNDVFVAKNKYISLAVVPEAAGRILEYNLGDVPSLWINPKLMGKSFGTSDEVKMNEWRNFGGYRLVPLPIENSSVNRNNPSKKSNRWPPPVVIGDAPYKVSIGKNKDGKKTIEVQSGVQELPVPTYFGKEKRFVYPNEIDEKIQYSRSLYIEPNSSMVFIDHKLKNVGNKVIKKGLMISSQHVSWSDSKLQDGHNFSAFIPFSKDLKLPNGEQLEISATPEQRWRYINRNRFKLDKNNPEHIKKYFNRGNNWKGEVAPGIYEVEYDYNAMAGLHIISSKSWIGYVNKITNTAFVKIMEPYNPKLEYDHGLNMAIFCSGLETGYIETEVKTPLYTIQPRESFNYKEIHGAAKIESSPILDVNHTGVITKKLFYKNNKINGSYGVFYEGTAILSLKNKKGKVIKEISLENVNPLKVLKLETKINLSKKVKSIDLLVRDSKSVDHVLDSLQTK
ncbi:hypothetical protein [Polaribacter sp. Z022]|uniref:hypothetical protein n=1 Tax=Polaribacter sp. Z022 TaxID=2927125 RepID=UPI00201FB55D|nr:hypothetical protein [Polaribacter sp. Z022]MCL7752659.1 hypothetical protein [Polaribacter sp. Z022]